MAGGDIWLTGWGDSAQPPLLIISPLFAEMNRCRRLIADLASGLCVRGIASWLIDLPGMGESGGDPATLALADWHQAVDAATDAIGARAVISLRGGALLGKRDNALPRWSLSAVDGPGIIRDLVRVRMASDREAGVNSTTATITEAAARHGIEIAGYWVSAALFDDLRNAALVHAPDDCAITLAKDASEVGPAAITGEPLWRRAEPGRSPAMASAMVDSITGWLA
jgi:hypothetical protein